MEVLLEMTILMRVDLEFSLLVKQRYVLSEPSMPVFSPCVFWPADLAASGYSYCALLSSSVFNLYYASVL